MLDNVEDYSLMYKLAKPLTSEGWNQMMRIGQSAKGRTPEWVVAELVTLKLVKKYRGRWIFTKKGKWAYSRGMKDWLAMGVS